MDRVAPTRVVVLGGFLGAGKTTMLLRLAEHHRAAGRRVGIIANDQGTDLVDSVRFRAAGLETGEVTGGCFCCRFDDFLARADELMAAHRPDVLLAEPVGSCTDIVATVVNPLRQLHPERFALAPFTVLVDPTRVLDLLTGRRSARLSEKITYIFRMQQLEAEAIAISKLDQLAAPERQQVAAVLAERFPGVRQIAVSAHTGEGMDELLAWLDGRTAPRPAPDVDYDVYAAGEAELGWLNASARIHSDAAADLDALAFHLASAIDGSCRAGELPIAHVKVLLRGALHTAAVSITDHTGPQAAQAANERARAADLLINMRVQAEPTRVRAALDAALAVWATARAVRVGPMHLESFSPPRPVPTHRLAEA